MKTSLLNGIIANSKTRVRCLICGVFIPKAHKCIEQHVNGLKHKENIQLMSENGINLLNDQLLYCRICNTNLDEKEPVNQHIENETHINWMASIDFLCEGEFVKVEKYLQFEEDDFYCSVCKCNVSPDLPTLEEHVNSFNHRSNVAEKLMPLNGIFHVDNDEELWCKVCDSYIANTVQSILDHIDEDLQHTEWFMEIVELIFEQEISIQDFLCNEHELNAYCNKCQTSILCDIQCIDDHVHSSAHIMQFIDIT